MQITPLQNGLSVIFRAFCLVLPPLSLLSQKAVVPWLLIVAMAACAVVWRVERRLPVPDRAVAMALARAMEEDETVVVLGEDVGVDGGVFRATEGLLERFGPERVVDTPLAETAIAGVAVGMAAQGLRPVAEIQFMGFIYPTIDQIVSHASRLRYRTRGRLTCPMVLRAPFGGGIHAPEHHSESTEAMFAHIPGLRVVIPSSPRRAYGLLLSAIRDPDPVVFLEPKRIYRAVREDFDDDGEGMPLDSCFIQREGTDITLVSWGAMIPKTSRTVPITSCSSRPMPATLVAREYA